MIKYGSQNIDKSDIKEVIKVLESDYLTQGPKVFEFEKVLAKYCGAKYAVAVNSGTAGLHLAYMAAGLKKGDEAITSPNTFVATANMLLECGVRPVFCDIRGDTCNIDEAKIEKLVNKKTKAIVPVHFAGHPCAMEGIKRVANKRGLIVIEDACQALGAKYKSSKIGDCKYSDMAVFSFHPVKSITTGEGGAILTNSKKLYERLIRLRSHGVTKDKNGFNVMTDFGYNYRISEMQAALGVSQIKRLDDFIKKRHQVVKWYKEELGDIKDIVLPAELKENRSAWHIYAIRVKDKKLRLLLFKHLLRNNIGVNFHFPCVYQHPYYKSRGFAGVKCPEAELYAGTAITLPLHTLLKNSDIKYIGKAIRKFFKVK